MGMLGANLSQRVFSRAPKYTVVQDDTASTTGVVPIPLATENILVMNGSLLYPCDDYTVDPSTNLPTLTIPAPLGAEFIALNLSTFTVGGSAKTNGDSTNRFSVATAVGPSDATPLAQVMSMITPVPVRQTVLSGVTDSNGRANFISAGSGLGCNLSATAQALVMAFAGGFGQYGAVDYVERLTADAANYWSGLHATPFEQRPMGLELSICRRYFETGKCPYLFINGLSSVTTAYNDCRFSVPKRTAPIMTLSSFQYWSSATPTAFTPSSVTSTVDSFNFQANSLTSWKGLDGTGIWTADAEL